MSITDIIQAYRTDVKEYDIHHLGCTEPMLNPIIDISY